MPTVLEVDGFILFAEIIDARFTVSGVEPSDIDASTRLVLVVPREEVTAIESSGSWFLRSRL